MCVGHSPCRPKSSEVRTSPRPKNCSQKRFTTTRAVSGLAGLMSHCARPNRLAGASGGSAPSAFGTARFTGRSLSGWS